MVKKIITLWMACFLLAGSSVLPLGDFSLLQDIPHMYHNYKEVVTADEAGIIDFVGDYLLHGKELLGHNGHDKPQTASNNVQFQHQPNPSITVLPSFHLCIIKAHEVQKKYTVCGKPIISSGYHKELFRPPLA